MGGDKYINVTAALNVVAGLPDQIADDETRIDALEVKQGILGNTKADTFIAQVPLYLKIDVSPNELYVEEPPPPIVANAIVSMGLMAISFSAGRTDVMDFTHDWSMAATVKIQGPGAQ